MTVEIKVMEDPLTIGKFQVVTMLRKDHDLNIIPIRNNLSHYQGVTLKINLEEILKNFDEKKDTLA